MDNAFPSIGKLISSPSWLHKVGVVSNEICHNITIQKGPLVDPKYFYVSLFDLLPVPRFVGQDVVRVPGDYLGTVVDVCHL